MMKRARKMATSRYVTLGTIGRGSHGAVTRRLNRKTLQLVAVKSVPKRGGEEEDEEEVTGRTRSEIAVLEEVRHENVVRLIRAVERPGKFQLEMELVRGDTLKRVLRAEPEGMPEERGRHVFRQIVDALRYLHHRRVVHLDLKTANVLVSRRDRIKIIDFGLSRKLGAAEEKVTVRAGTPRFVAPEIGAPYPVDPYKCDVWSCGVILVHMFVASLRRLPTPLALRLADARNSLARDLAPMSEPCRDLALLACAYQPRHRPRADFMLNHRWLRVPES